MILESGEEINGERNYKTVIGMLLDAREFPAFRTEITSDKETEGVVRKEFSFSFSFIYL